MERQDLLEIAKTGVCVDYSESHQLITGTPLIHIGWDLGAMSYSDTYCLLRYTILYKNGRFRERPDHPTMRLLHRTPSESQKSWEDRAREQIKKDFRLNSSQFHGEIRDGYQERALRPTTPYFLTQIGRMQMILDYHDDWLRVKEDYRYYEMIKRRFEQFVKAQHDKWKEFGFGH